MMAFLRLSFGKPPPPPPTFVDTIAQTLQLSGFPPTKHFLFGSSQ